MAKAKDSVVLAEFPGLASRPDAMDISPGAAIVQENLMSHDEGKLRTRGGAQPVTFEEE